MAVCKSMTRACCVKIRKEEGSAGPQTKRKEVCWAQTQNARGLAGQKTQKEVFLLALAQKEEALLDKNPGGGGLAGPKTRRRRSCWA